jgi:hypothetical protein
MAPQLWIHKLHTYTDDSHEGLATTAVAEPGGSTPLLSELAIGHDPKPVPSNSHPHNLSPKGPIHAQYFTVYTAQAAPIQF